MTIACLGWGSLIWDPQTLPVKEDDWLNDGPSLPLEFARRSSKERVTLVIMNEGPTVPVLWCKLPCNSIIDATGLLRKREKTKTEWIGRWPQANQASDLHSEIIAEWARAKGLDGVVWTAIPPKWNEENGCVPSLDDILTHLERLGSAKANDAIKYIRRAPRQIETPFRPHLEKAVREFA